MFNRCRYNVISESFGSLTVRGNAKNVINGLGTSRRKHNGFGLIHIDQSGDRSSSGRESAFWFDSKEMTARCIPEMV